MTTKMPELPEIETVRRGLERETVGRRVKSAEVSDTKAVRRNGTKKAFESRLEGAKCPVIDACLKHALSVREPYGVWGGMSEEERARLIAAEPAAVAAGV